MSDVPEPASGPALRIVSGDPTAEELAALVAVLAGHPAAAESSERLRSGWTDRDAALRRPLHPAPDGWRATARPR